MLQILGGNDLVGLSWTQAECAAAAIPGLLLDEQTSAIAGSIGAIPQRLSVGAEDAACARWLRDLALTALEGSAADGKGG